ncbi:MAG: glycoside hydrolase family 30 protein [Lachnospiraceae bacterium]|nr:glycoside hydrolase family 30 protein [Lachnospiraceae bacterium]
MRAQQNTVFYDQSTGTASFSAAEYEVISEENIKEVVESHVIGIYPDYTFQTMEGFGCAMTETSCYLLSRMTPEFRTAALKTWFGPEGMDARFVRMHIDSCDYSLEEYQAVEDPIADPELETFSIKRDLQWNIPVMKEAMELAGHPISVLLSPWSPPYQWKTPPEITQNDAAVYGGMGMKVDLTKPGRCFGGRLKPEYYGSWAKYLVKFIKAYLAEGINVTMLSIQNEAAAATNWDSCLWTGEQEKEFLTNHLYPQMKAAGLTDKVQIFIWDHNKERAIEHIDAFMSDPEAAAKISGFAYHWYSGDHFDALSLLHGRYPDKVLMHSESCPLHMPGKAFAFEITEEMMAKMDESHRQMYASRDPKAVDFQDAVDYAHDIIGDLNHGMQRWIDWNLIVDRKGGPRHVPGGFGSPVVYEEDGTFSKTIAYEYLNLIAKTVRAGAVVLGKSIYGKDAEAAAVRNTDGSIGVLLLNQTAEEIRVNIRFCGQIIRDVVLPAKTLSGLLIK